MNAMNVLVKSRKINANADIINRLGEEIKAYLHCWWITTAYLWSSTNVTAERLVRDAKAYAGWQLLINVILMIW